MGTVLVVYASRSGETEKIANLIAEGVRMTGNEASVKSVADIKNETDLQGFDGYAFVYWSRPHRNLIAPRPIMAI